MKRSWPTILPRPSWMSPASSKSQRRVASNSSSPANRDIRSATCGLCPTTATRWFGASGRWLSCRLPDALLEALQLSHLPDAPNQRVAVVGHRPQVAERMSRFAGDEELLATRRCDFELAGLIHEGLGKIVGHDRFIKVQHGLYLLCCGVERSISDDLT